MQTISRKWRLCSSVLLICTTLWSLTGCEKNSSQSNDPLIQQVENLISDKKDEGLAQAFTTIHKAPQDKNAVVIAWLKQKSDSLPAPFMMELGSRVFAQDHNAGLRWYILGRIRASYDARRCTDRTASQAISALVMEYPEIFKYFRAHRKDKDYLKTWKEALDWEKTHPYSASPSWICSHGIQAFRQSPASLTVPKEDWPEIRAKTLQETEAFLKKHLEEVNKH